MNVQKINSASPANNNSHKTSFGSVIPFRVKVNNVLVNQSADNQDIMKSVSYQIARLISGTSELGAKIKAQFQSADRAFDGNFRTIRKGYMETVFDRKTARHKIVPVVEERFFATGADAICANKTGYQIGCNQRDDASRAINLENESDLCTDIKNRIKGLQEILVDVKSYITKKGTPEQTTKYKVTGVEFVKTPQPVKPKKVKPPLTEAQTKLAKADKRAKKKAKYNPNQQIFSFVPEVEKIQETKETREKVAQMWANH